MNVLSQRGYAYSDVTGAVIGSALEVHSILGAGFQEVVYQRALAVEMEKRGLSFAREWEVPIFYKERQVGPPASRLCPSRRHLTPACSSSIFARTAPCSTLVIRGDAS